MRQKEKVKQVRDGIVPLLISQAQLEMLNFYKPGMVEPLGEATIGVSISTEPIRSVQGPFIRRDFYACYKVLIPVRPLIPLKDSSAREILREHVQTRIQATHGHIQDAKPESTLVIYWSDFWVTRDGEVWHEDADGLWTNVLQLPEHLLQASHLNLRTSLRVKYVV